MMRGLTSCATGLAAFVVAATAFAGSFPPGVTYPLKSAVLLGFGSYFGLHALAQKNDAATACGSGCALGSAPQQENGDAKTSAAVSTGLFIGAGVALALGVVLWLTSPKASSRSSSMQRMAPFVSF